VASKSLMLSVLFWGLKVSYSNSLVFRALSGSFRPLQRPSGVGAHCGARRIDPIRGRGKNRYCSIYGTHLYVVPERYSRSCLSFFAVKVSCE
jgi:hypothetical protein